jgi:hypothetical protein
MRNIFGRRAIDSRYVLEGVEVFAPTVGNTARVGQIVLIHFLDIRRIATEEIRVALVGGVDGFCLTHFSLTFAPLQGALVG